MNAIVCKVSILQQLGVSTGPVWKIPLVDDLTVNIDEVDSTRAGEVGEERVSWRHVMVVKASQTKTPADQCALLHDSELNSKGPLKGSNSCQFYMSLLSGSSDGSKRITGDWDDDFFGRHHESLYFSSHSRCLRTTCFPRRGMPVLRASGWWSEVRTAVCRGDTGLYYLTARHAAVISASRHLILNFDHTAVSQWTSGMFIIMDPFIMILVFIHGKK